MKRALGALGTAVAAGGCAATIPLLAGILGATLGMAVVVGLYALRLFRRQRRQVG
jgi:hypothetical protein